MKFRSNELFKQWVSPDVEQEALGGYAFASDLLSKDIVVVDDCYFFKSLQPDMTKFIPDRYIIDRTGKECFHNKVHISDILSADSPSEQVKCGLYFAVQLARKIQNQFGHAFNVILSYDKEYCVVRFHKVRMNENWSTDNLEDYKMEAVLLINIPGE